jgi:metallo-beta-lactamase family protein
MSAHGDYNDLMQFIACQDPLKVKKIFLVHGEYDVQQNFVEKIQARGYRNIEIPERHQEFILD